MSDARFADLKHRLIHNVFVYRYSKECYSNIQDIEQPTQQQKKDALDVLDLDVDRRAISDAVKALINAAVTRTGKA